MSISFGNSNLSTTGTLQSGNLTASAITSGDVTINGNLNVTGTTTTVNTTNVTVSDPIMVLSSGATGAATVDSGILIERGDDDNVAFIWDESDDTFSFIKTSDDGTGTANINIGMTDQTSGYMNIRAGSLRLGDLVLDSTKLNLISGLTAGTAQANKTVVLDSNKHVDTVHTKDLYLGESGSTVRVTSSADELNLLDGAAANTVVNSTAVIYSATGGIKANLLDAQTLTSGEITVNGTANIGTVTSADGTIGDISFNNNIITSSSDNISFIDNNLTTTGNISSNDGVFSGTVDVTGKLTSTSAEIGNLKLEGKVIKIGIDSVIDFSNDKVTVGELHSTSLTTGAISGTDITASGTITGGNSSKLGDITFGQGSLTTDSGLFNLGNDGIKTTGALEVSSAKVTSTLSVTDVITGDSGAVLGNITISNGSISSSGTAISFGNDNLSTTGTITGAANSKLADITFNDGSIKSTSGEIDFDNENLVTTGTFSAGNISGSVINLSGDATVNGIVIAASGSKLADFTFTNGMIKSNSGTINFDNEDIKTIGSLSVSSSSQVLISNLTITK